MSLSKRVSLPPQPPSQPNQDLKHRVITCLNKLSDRDTLSVATTELESIALTLTHDSFAPFLTYLSNTTSSDKSPVRKQCVRLLGLLSVTHGDALSPHVFKMLSSIIRRLRDPDSAVRSACVASVTSIASEITSPSFSSLSKPLVDAVMTEQDHNSQIGSALCLSAAIEASMDPEPVYLQKLLPRVLKLVKSDGFKAKPALLSVIGSIAGAGGTGLNRSLVNSLVLCLVEFLSSEDWAARKAAVEALGRLAVTEKENLTSFRSSCIVSLENKRFDKVKVVRESMNQTLELWKEIPDEVPVSPQLNGNSSSSKVPATSLETSPKERIPSSKHSPIHRSSPTATPSRSPPKSNYKKQTASIARKMDFDQKTDTQVNFPVPEPESARKMSFDQKNNTKVSVAVPEPASARKMSFDQKTNTKVSIAVPEPASARKMSFDQKTNTKVSIPVPEPEGDTLDIDKNIILETEKRVISNKTRFGSRVVPVIDESEFDRDMNANPIECAFENQKEVEDLSRIQKQLVQIENQQSNLLNLLQKFIGSSRSGMNSLETRVNGLEKTLDEISYDFAISTGRVSRTDSCCMGTEFLSPKYWRRAEGSFPSLRSPFRGGNQSHIDTCLPRSGFENQGRGIDTSSNARKKKAAQGQNRNFDRFDGGFLANCIQQRM